MHLVIAYSPSRMRLTAMWNVPRFLRRVQPKRAAIILQQGERGVQPLMKAAIHTALLNVPLEIFRLAVPSRFAKPLDMSGSVLVALIIIAGQHAALQIIVLVTHTVNAVVLADSGGTMGTAPHAGKMILPVVLANRHVLLKLFGPAMIRPNVQM